MSNTASRVAKNTGFLYIKMGVTMFVSLYTTRLVLNALGDSDYGIFSIVGGAIALLGFFNSSLSGSTQRFMSYAEGSGDMEKKRYIFNISFILHFFLGLILIALLIIAGFIFFNGVLKIPEGREHAAIIVYGSLIFSTAFSVMSVPYEAVLNSHENMRYFAIVGIVESLLKLGVAFVCVYVLMDKLIVYGILMTLVPIIILIIMRVYCNRHYEECVIAPRKYYDKNLIKDMTSFAGWRFLSSMAAMGTMQGMAILLNVFGGVIVNTAHGIANQLSGQVMAFSNTMLKALNPVLVKSCGAGQMQQMLKESNTGNKLSFFCFAIFALPFLVETPYILQVWLKEVPEWAVLFCRLVFIRQMISQFYVTLETCISATGKIKKYSIISSLLWSLPLVVGFLMYSLGAPIYTIYVLLIVLALLRGCNALYFCWKLCDMDILQYIRETVFPMILCAMIVLISMWGLVHFLETGGMRCILVITTSMLLFSVLCYFLLFNIGERKQIMNVISTFMVRFKKVLKTN